MNWMRLYWTSAFVLCSIVAAVAYARFSGEMSRLEMYAAIAAVGIIGGGIQAWILKKAGKKPK
jgi:hypothetical protein